MQSFFAYELHQRAIANNINFKSKLNELRTQLTRFTSCCRLKFHSTLIDSTREIFSIASLSFSILFSGTLGETFLSKLLIPKQNLGRNGKYRGKSGCYVCGFKFDRHFIVKKKNFLWVLIDFFRIHYIFLLENISKL